MIDMANRPAPDPRNRGGIRSYPRRVQVISNGYPTARSRRSRTWAVGFGPLQAGIGLVLFALLSVPLLIIIGFFGYYQWFGRILPGVAVGETQLVGLDQTQAAIEIHRTWNLERRLRVTDGLHTWDLPPNDLGIRVDPLETVRRAYAVGHDQSLLAEIDQMAYSLQNGWGIAPAVVFDPQAGRSGLERLSKQASLPAVDAALYLEGDQLTAKPGSIGYTINIDDCLRALSADPLGVLLGGTFQLALKPVIPRINDVSAVRNQAQRLLDSPPTLHAYDPILNEWLDFPMERSVVASWLQIENGPDGPRVWLDESRIVASVSEIQVGGDASRWLDVESYPGSLSEAIAQGQPVTFRVRHQPGQVVVQPGDTLLKIGWRVGMPFWMLLRANPQINPEHLHTGQTLVVPSKDDLLPFPVVMNKRIVISIGQQRLWTYQDGTLRSEHVISTGIDRSPTQPGVFQVQTHELNAYAQIWDLTMPHFLGIYEAWPGFMNGIHGLPTLSNGRILWANVLGKPASYGCIILDLQAAADLYNWAENGVVVEIQP
jgi:lipoprotein-anchoring transpeptidase ErfK/SrfK